MAKKPGPKCLLNDEIQEKICDALRRGCYIETAAHLVGITRETFYNWLKKGANQNQGRFKDFSIAVHKAIAESELKSVCLLEDAQIEDWKAAAWRLERRFPKRWGQIKKHQLEDITDKEEENLDGIEDMDADKATQVFSRFIRAISSDR